MRKKKDNKKINFNFSSYDFDRFLVYLLSNHPLVNKTTIKTLNEILNNINENDYNDNDEIAMKLFYCKKAIYSIIELNRHSLHEIIDYLEKQKKYELDDFENILDNIDEYFDEDEKVDDNIIIETDNFISSIQKFNIMFSSTDDLERTILKYKENDYDNVESMAKEFSDCISNIYQKIKIVNNITSDYLDDFNSNDSSNFKFVLNNFKNKIDSPAHKLKTMVKTRNEFLSGGYEAGMCYCVLGLSGKGKSIELQNIALDIKEANQSLEYVSGKKSVILYVSQENNIFDFLKRTFSYYGIDRDENNSELSKTDIIKKKTIQELYQDLNEKTNFCKGPELVFKYRRTNSISTADIEKYIEEIEQDGDKKVIVVIQDYIGLIRAASAVNSSYEDLGQISREYCDIAKVYDLAFITAQQFNRKASEIVEEALKNNKPNPLSLINGSYIADSNQIFYNVNCVYSILKKRDPITGEFVMSYNMLKDRSDDGSSTNDITKFSHPFDEGKFRLKPDLGSVKNYSILNEGDGLESKTIKQLREKKTKKITKSSSELDEKIADIINSDD